MLELDNKHVVAAQVTGGGFLVYISKFDLSQWSFIVGMSVAVLGLCAGFYWQYRRDKRERILNDAMIKAIKEKGVVLNEDHLD
jgi:hypothetical protein